MEQGGGRDLDLVDFREYMHYTKIVLPNICILTGKQHTSEHLIGCLAICDNT